MEVKSKERKTFTYTLTLNTSEVKSLLSELVPMMVSYETRYPKTYSMVSKLQQAHSINDEDNE